MDVGPGDRVRCVDISPSQGSLLGAESYLALGAVYSVEWVGIDPDFGIPIVRLVGVDHERWCEDTRADGWTHYGAGLYRFRKLPDISEWLETSTSYEEPRRVPAPREVEGV